VHLSFIRAPSSFIAPKSIDQRHMVLWGSDSIKRRAMKSDIHPNYGFITITQTDGSTYVTRSTMGGEGKKLNLDIDPLAHPAWTGGNSTVLDRAGRVSRFNDKFGGFFKK
jgi:large subunit ribosomal protein L31